MSLSFRSATFFAILRSFTRALTLLGSVAAASLASILETFL
jgi:hypothetical protein